MNQAEHGTPPASAFRLCRLQYHTTPVATVQAQFDMYAAPAATPMAMAITTLLLLRLLTAAAPPGNACATKQAAAWLECLLGKPCHLCKWASTAHPTTHMCTHTGGPALAGGQDKETCV